MNKSKIVSKMGLSQLVIKSLKGQQLNENEIYLINSNRIKGLLHMNVVQKGEKFKLIYDVTGFVTFQQFLQAPLNKESFGKILQNILETLHSIENAYLNQKYLLMDFTRVMVNPATEHIYFVYVPIQSFEGNASLRDFLLDIIQHCAFVSGEDNSYVRDYISILNSGINFSVFELEQYINKLLGKNVESTKMHTCPSCGAQVKSGTRYCSCGMKLSGHTETTAEKTYNPLSEDDSCETPVVDRHEYEQETEQGDTQGLSDKGTTVLGIETGGTTVLGYESLGTPSYPYLIREKNKEKILIDKPVFRIGKERKFCDYFVADNNAVSRSHADIITREKRYYICDLNSTNKTYVDGRVIPVEKEMEIFSGTKLRLANEDFVFYIET